MPAQSSRSNQRCDAAPASVFAFYHAPIPTPLSRSFRSRVNLSVLELEYDFRRRHPLA